MEKKKSLFKRHKILTGILCLFALLFISFLFSDSSSSNISPDKIITTPTKLLLPQDLEIDRIWRISNTTLSSNATGFIEGSQIKISKSENMESSSIELKAYRFDSINNSNEFYFQEKNKLDTRGISEWAIADNCFGVCKDALLSGYSEGICLRNNIVFYVYSVSSSTTYKSDGKNFMKIMLNKI